jgi:hypothetical protein
MRECKKSGNAGVDTRELTRDGVLHYGLAIYIKSILRQKKKNYGKFKYFTMQKYINLQKEKNPPLKETKILQDMHNS